MKRLGTLIFRGEPRIEGGWKEEQRLYQVGDEELAARLEKCFVVM